LKISFDLSAAIHPRKHVAVTVRIRSMTKQKTHLYNRIITNFLFVG